MISLLLFTIHLRVDIREKLTHRNRVPERKLLSGSLPPAGSALMNPTRRFKFHISVSGTGRCPRQEGWRSWTIEFTTSVGLQFYLECLFAVGSPCLDRLKWHILRHLYYMDSPLDDFIVLYGHISTPRKSMGKQVNSAWLSLHLTITNANPLYSHDIPRNTAPRVRHSLLSHWSKNVSWSH